MALVVYETVISNTKIKTAPVAIDIYLIVLSKHRFVKFLMDNTREHSF